MTGKMPVPQETDEWMQCQLDAP